MEIIKYNHHGKQMSVQEHLKGKHREHCLCFQKCMFFSPGESDNCDTAQAIFEFDVKHGVTTPVWECEQYTKML